jgi:hypothetical protein
MVSLHQELGSLAGNAPAVLVETPYGFQENVDEVTQKARRYFGGNVGVRVEVPDGLRAPAEEEGAAPDRAVAALRSAGWVFAGPGSPSYAVRQWLGSPVANAFSDRLRRPGVTVFASAAACAVGSATLPVYEIYKVGTPPAWLPGLDLLGQLEIPVAVIPHFDNAEGGTHDTRYCYAGERRLVALEAQLSGGTAILGVDEHTAVLLDLDRETATVRGRGGMTIRRQGDPQWWGAGSELSFADLRAIVAGSARPPASRPAPAAPAEAHAAETTRTLEEVARGCEQQFDEAQGARDGAGMARAVLELDAAITGWSTDTLDTDAADQARSVLRALVVRLGDAAQTGLADPRDRLGPLVEPIVELRAALRERREWQAADALRDALAAGGVEVRDTPDGSAWDLAES